MSRHDPRLTLRQIGEYGAQARELCAGTTLDALKSDWRARAALERVLECMGEAVKRLPEELREKYPAVPWRKIAGMRDLIAHAYDTVDHETLWGAVESHLPAMLQVIAQMLADLGSS